MGEVLKDKSAWAEFDSLSLLREGPKFDLLEMGDDLKAGKQVTKENCTLTLVNGQTNVSLKPRLSVTHYWVSIKPLPAEKLVELYNKIDDIDIDYKHPGMNVICPSGETLRMRPREGGASTTVPLVEKVEHVKIPLGKRLKERFKPVRRVPIDMVLVQKMAKAVSNGKLLLEVDATDLPKGYEQPYADQLSDAVKDILKNVKHTVKKSAEKVHLRQGEEPKHRR